jgi:transposase
MIAFPSGAHVWLATGHTDMRRGFPSLALLVQEVLKRDPHAGDLYVFRGRRGDLIKLIWHDGQGACLFTKRLERWGGPMAFDGRWRRDDLGGAIVLSAFGNRLANAAESMAPEGGGISAAD